MDLHEPYELVQFSIHCQLYHHLGCQELHGHQQMLFQELCHIPADTSSSPPEVQKYYLNVRNARQNYSYLLQGTFPSLW